jgi:hypothetical protein
LHKNQPLSFEELLKAILTRTGAKEHALEKSLKYDHLNFLTEREIIKVLRKDGDPCYVLYDYDELEVKVRWATEDFELLNCRWPSVREVATTIGKTPKETEEVVYKTATKIGWKPPPEKSQWKQYLADAQSNARRRLELAAWIKLGCEESKYVKEQWPEEEEELRKASQIRDKCTEYLPKIEAYRYRGDGKERFYCRLWWPKVAEEITGMRRLGDLMIRKGYVSSKGTVRMVRTIDFEGYLDKLKIEERPRKS